MDRPPAVPGAIGFNEAKSIGTEAHLGDMSVPQIRGQTEIRVGGKLVATTPKSDSMTLAQAAEWYRGQMSDLGSKVDKRLPVDARIVQTEQLAQESLTFQAGKAAKGPGSNKKFP